MKYVRVIIAVLLLFVLAACGSEQTEESVAAEAETTEGVVVSSDDIVQLIADADPTNGEALYNEMNATGFSCANCHNANNEDRLMGPGLLDIHTRAETRVEGQVAERYLYDSIVHPNEFIVQDTIAYSAGLMPQNYADVYSEEELYDIVAYLLTLGD
ncbi:MAG: cytochrome c [Aggregatilineales bacterium]